MKKFLLLEAVNLLLNSKINVDKYKLKQETKLFSYV